LKGGDLAEEINEVIEYSQKTKIKLHAIGDIYNDQPFFETKKVVKLFHGQIWKD
jgi:predicted mannosyl-3-phosphoglycerate phosphatase (HAD superfamily)